MWNQIPRKYQVLSKALNYFESSTHSFPFIISVEIKKIRVKNISREFYAYNNISEYFTDRSKGKCIHTHEIIRQPTTDIMIGERGRLCFDFDIDDETWNNKDKFKIFRDEIQKLINFCFKNYYLDVDTSLFKYMWQHSYNFEGIYNKFSTHLIVKNAFFCENWINQIKVFYRFFQIQRKKLKILPEIKGNLLDFQIARNNATLRMIFSCKLKIDEKNSMNVKLGNFLIPIIDNEPYIVIDNKGNFTKSLDSTIFRDNLIQIYKIKDLKNEQFISDFNLNKLKIDFATQKLNINHEIISDENITKALEIASNEIEDFTNKFEFDTITHSRFISLRTKRPYECPVSLNKITHDNENPFLMIISDEKTLTKKVRFYCRRNCRFEGKNWINIGTINRDNHT